MTPAANNNPASAATKTSATLADDGDAADVAEDVAADDAADVVEDVAEDNACVGMTTTPCTAIYHNRECASLETIYKRTTKCCSVKVQYVLCSNSVEG